MRNKAGAGGLVYSTAGGRMCPACRKPVPDCICAAPTPASRSADGVVRISRETSGRGGKTVTVIRGLGLRAEALDALAKRLRAACGTGGTSKEGVLELQGDHCDRLMECLRDEGFAVKRAGG